MHNFHSTMKQYVVLCKIAHKNRKGMRIFYPTWMSAKVSKGKQSATLASRSIQYKLLNSHSIGKDVCHGFV